MPPACTTGLHAFAPELPQLHEHQQEAQGIQKSRDEHHVLDLRASIGSANVASMYNGTWGHAGKTIYLRQQFQAMRMLFLGLQETRTPETFSTADGVLRFGSGHAEGGLYGVKYGSISTFLSEALTRRCSTFKQLISKYYTVIQGCFLSELKINIFNGPSLLVTHHILDLLLRVVDTQIP
jgi:hypothetical protein